MGWDGIVDVHITSGSVNDDVFCEFIKKNLLPQLLPFNGINGRSVVAMDNASIHHTERATALIEEIGAIPIFLTPYSPDIMPIEECFSKVKSFLWANDQLKQILWESDIEDTILAAFAKQHLMIVTVGLNTVGAYYSCYNFVSLIFFDSTIDAMQIAYNHIVCM